MITYERAKELINEYTLGHIAPAKDRVPDIGFSLTRQVKGEKFTVVYDPSTGIVYSDMEKAKPQEHSWKYSIADKAEGKRAIFPAKNGSKLRILYMETVESPIEEERFIAFRIIEMSMDRPSKDKLFDIREFKFLPHYDHFLFYESNRAYGFNGKPLPDQGLYYNNDFIYWFNHLNDCAYMSYFYGLEFMKFMHSDKNCAEPYEVIEVVKRMYPRTNGKSKEDLVNFVERVALSNEELSAEFPENCCSYLGRVGIKFFMAEGKPVFQCAHKNFGEDCDTSYILVIDKGELKFFEPIPNGKFNVSGKQAKSFMYFYGKTRFNWEDAFEQIPEFAPFKDELIRAFNLFESDEHEFYSRDVNVMAFRFIVSVFKHHVAMKLAKAAPNMAATGFFTYFVENIKEIHKEYKGKKSSTLLQETGIDETGWGKISEFCAPFIAQVGKKVDANYKPTGHNETIGTHDVLWVAKSIAYMYKEYGEAETKEISDFLLYAFKQSAWFTTHDLFYKTRYGEEYGKTATFEKLFEVYKSNKEWFDKIVYCIRAYGGSTADFADFRDMSESELDEYIATNIPIY